MDQDFSEADAQALQELYSHNEVYKAALDHFASRKNNSRETTAERLAEELEGATGRIIPESELRSLFKDLEAIGFGEYIIGRRGKLTRIRWHKDLKDIGRVAAGATNSTGGATPQPVSGATQPVPLPQTPPQSARLMQLEYPLREDLLIKLALPLDMTKVEAQQLANRILALAV